jgi:hypothetical protein
MLRHFVIFSYKPGFLTPEVVKELEDGFALIQKDVEGVKEVHIYLNTVDRPANMDLMIEMLLKDASVLDQYLPHPEHVRLGQKMNPFVEHRVSFDHPL